MQTISLSLVSWPIINSPILIVQSRAFYICPTYNLQISSVHSNAIHCCEVCQVWFQKKVRLQRRVQFFLAVSSYALARIAACTSSDHRQTFAQIANFFALNTSFERICCSKCTQVLNTFVHNWHFGERCCTCCQYLIDMKVHQKRPN